MSGPVNTIPTALASAADVIARYSDLCNDIDPILIDDAVEAATAEIEERTGRRLAPFTNHVYRARIFGIDPDEYGGGNDMVPLSFYGSTGMSYANAIGAGDLVRHFWLDQYAPFYPGEWSYTIEKMELILTYGSSQPIDFLNGGIVGPDETTGHCWLRLGTFAPEGSRISVHYSGGYTGGIPPSLKRACIFLAAKFLVLEAEPQLRTGMDLTEIDNQIDTILAPWAK